MLFDFEVRACTRVCAESGNALQPGSAYFSVLALHDNEVVRSDYAVESWQGPPKQHLGWWRSRMPEKVDRPKLAPAEVMLNLFVSLAECPAEQQFRYVLGLLLMRKKTLRRVGSSIEEGRHILLIDNPKTNDQYELVVDEPDGEAAEQIQQKMIDLLYGDGEFFPQPSGSEAA
ncbi:MAG: hypothetical protein AAGD11_20100 [Planctomycetota bacterium]